LSALHLGVESIGLHYLHSGRATDASFEDQIGALAELRQAGLILNIGLSNVALEQLRIAQRIVPIAAVTGIPGTTSPDHLGENLLAQFITLSPAEMAVLEGIGGVALEPGSPVPPTGDDHGPFASERTGGNSERRPPAR
jgi:aryl-alcohol dehydrogenase-like predicted oxidoreductase